MLFTGETATSSNLHDDESCGTAESCVIVADTCFGHGPFGYVAYSLCLVAFVCSIVLLCFPHYMDQWSLERAETAHAAQSYFEHFGCDTSFLVCDCFSATYVWRSAGVECLYFPSMYCDDDFDNGYYYRYPRTAI